MKKIIHLSDLHVGYDGLVDRLHYILTQIICLKTPADKYVVVTGDLVDNGNNDKNFVAAKRALDRLSDTGFQVLVSPGNHDYGSGTRGHERLVEHFKKVFVGTNNVTYPKLDIIDDAAFIGLDSMAEELHWYDSLFAQGELGKKQLDRLSEVLSTPPVRNCRRRVLYLHHHPFDPILGLQLKDSDELRVVLKKFPPVDALLYGHNHEGKIRHGAWNIKRCYDAGTTTRKQGSPGFHRVIDLERDPSSDYDGNFHQPYINIS